MSDVIDMEFQDGVIVGEGSGSDEIWLPAVNSDGDLSWSKSSTSTAPETVNIKGPAGADGAPGAPGADGADGTDGVGIASVSVNASNHLIVTKTDGTTQDAGEIQGGGGASIDDSTPAYNKVYSSQKVEDIFTNSNVLRGKKWCVCGDSFSAGDFTGYVDSEGHSGTESDAYDPEMGMYKTYPWWIAKRNNMSLTMLAKNGTRFTNISGASGVFSKPTSTVNYTQIPADADYVTIWYGLNETGLTAEQIGTKEDTTNATLWGAYNVVFSSILDNNPLAKIGVFISDGELFDGIPQAYHDALIDICKYWAIPYLDLRNGENVPMGLGRLDDCSQASRRKRKEAFQVYSQNIHPGVNGHKYRSTFIENFLRSL